VALPQYSMGEGGAVRMLVWYKALPPSTDPHERLQQQDLAGRGMTDANCGRCVPKNGTSVLLASAVQVPYSTTLKANPTTNRLVVYHSRSTFAYDVLFEDHMRCSQLRCLDLCMDVITSQVFTSARHLAACPGTNNRRHLHNSQVQRTP
jgi:hypothetical protein